MADIKLTKRNSELKLVKDAGIDLSQGVVVGLSWGANKVPGASKIDLDLMCILSVGDDVNDTCKSVDWFLSPSFNTAFKLKNNRIPVVVMGSDNTDGEDRPDNEFEKVFGPAFAGVKTDDEYLQIHFCNVPKDVQRITIPVNIFEGSETFGNVDDAHITVYGANGRAYVKCDLSTEDNVAPYSVVNFVQFDRGEDDDWKMTRVAEGYNASLEEMIKSYGLNLRQYAEKYAPWVLGK